ncbi:uncharacterized protein LOC119648617 [Hermetia illucens]|uniref:uncharacterized protein LOC119648617 n=1 Tax=Hermetia illucens TaxID=343691 RepID=UPI0018CC6322|nr:uncharacterized protein LOC119648617 [Hermetia illucens]
MAASVYATPPPDLSSEDTALSDVSNSSQISSSSSQSKATKRNIASIFSGSHASSNAFDSAQNDQSKKRRKQSTPIRISAINLSSNFALNIGGGGNSDVGDTNANINASTSNSTNSGVDAEQKLPKHVIPMLEQQEQQNDDPSSMEVFETDISSLNRYQSSEHLAKGNKMEKQEEDEDDTGAYTSADIEEGEQKDSVSRDPTKKCGQCGEQFESDVKLNVHILKNHNSESNDPDRDNTHQSDIENITAKIKIEPELMESGANESRIMANMPRPEDWLTMSGLNFPFPPEAAAAAALSASNYLSQLPLLSVPPVGAFPSVEGLSRPPLRIFNPEAYCDLCNKEFCNKYFLKTHKANKHGIYDPANSTNESPTASQINQISQVLQLQFQQQQQNQVQQHQIQNQQQQHHHHQPQQEHSPSTAEVAVYCDICHKRFTNVFAMKRHRNKAHEIPPPNSPHQIKTEIDTGGSNDKENATPVRMPEGFREDFAVEQEDVSFTPQPRKLSPASSQQAREANFSVEKLKRLGVVNPEAFCDLCCKEYCNKYFLRTHKLKRHGILVPADDPKDEKLPWHFVQTTPLNLMVGSEKTPRKSVDSEVSSKAQKAEMDEVVSARHTEAETKGKESNRGSESSEKNNAETSGFPQDPDAISIDLQKLQSMILQLNDLGNQRPVACHFCGKELENQYMLHAHITTDHSADNNNHVPKSPRTLSPSTSGIGQNEVCKQCDKEFPNLIDLKQHIFEVHGLPLSSPVREGFITPERPVATTSVNLPTTPTQAERRPPYTITPTSSYCEICNKELCNKYFMKTHMQRMHGIEIENGAQIGGVVCNICNKELCSKYFLRVHKHNTHGIVEEGSPLPQSRQNGEQQDVEALPFSIDPSQKTDLADISNRYFTHYTEVCPLCSRRFRSSKWLRAHLMSDHGKAGTEKLRELEQQMNFTKSSSPTLKIPNGGGLALNNLDPNLLAKGAFPNLIMTDEPANTSPRLKEYQCSICSFSTPYYAFLFIHERSHSFIANPSPPSSIKSENAVSIAKDQQRVAQPSNLTTSSGTPTVTPTSTPAPQTPQENASGIKRDREREKGRERDRDRERDHDRDPINIASLGDLANITNRPTSYALPQRSTECEIMQSFLIEEFIPDCNSQHSSASSLNGGSRPNGMINIGNRFVPALVFLPVRERISGAITVSFTLTPA